MQYGVVANGRVVGHGQSRLVIVAAKIQHRIVAFASDKQVIVGRNKRLVRTGQQRHVIRDELEDVVPRSGEDQVRRLAIASAKQYVVAFSTEYPFLTRAAGQNVVARPAEDHIPPLGALVGRHGNGDGIFETKLDGQCVFHR